MQFTKSAYRYFKCHCGFVFIWPRPSQQKLQDMYRDYGEHYWITQRMVNFAFSPTKSWREIQFVAIEEGVELGGVLVGEDGVAGG